MATTSCADGTTYTQHVLCICKVCLKQHCIHYGVCCVRTTMYKGHMQILGKLGRELAFTLCSATDFGFHMAGVMVGCRGPGERSSSLIA